MLRETLPAAALALVLGAAPAFAQPAPAPASAPPDDSSTAARTLEQNRRVVVWQPAPSETLRGMAVGSAAPAARVDEAQATPPAGRAGSVGGGKPGARGRS